MGNCKHLYRCDNRPSIYIRLNTLNHFVSPILPNIATVCILIVSAIYISLHGFYLCTFWLLFSLGRNARAMGCCCIGPLGSDSYHFILCGTPLTLFVWASGPDVLQNCMMDHNNVTCHVYIVTLSSYPDHYGLSLPIRRTLGPAFPSLPLSPGCSSYTLAVRRGWL